MTLTRRAVLALVPGAFVAGLVTFAGSAGGASAPLTIDWSDTSGFAPVTATPALGQAVVWRNTALNRLTVSRTVAPTFSVVVSPSATSAPLPMPSASAGAALAYSGDTRDPAGGLLFGATHDGVLVVPARATPTASRAATTSSSPTTSPATTSYVVAATTKAGAVPSHRVGASRSPSASPAASLASLPPDLALGVLPTPSVGGLNEPAPLVAAPPGQLEAPVSASPGAATSTLRADASGRGLAGEPVAGKDLGLPMALGLTLLLGVGTAVIRAVRRMRQSGGPHPVE